MRGEYDTRLFARSWWWELPPRARRIPKPWLITAVKIGTTSACAENTPFKVETNIFERNYLRVRGEYFSHMVGKSYQLELPPRARRIHSAGHESSLR